MDIIHWRTMQKLMLRIINKPKVSIQHFSKKTYVCLMAINVDIVKSFVEENLRGIHTLEDVATGLGVSLESLKKEFLRKERMGLSEYISILRVEKMKEKLVQSEDKCMIICLDLGVRDDVGANLFKKVTGLTMGVYRRQNRILRTKSDSVTGKL